VPIEYPVNRDKAAIPRALEDFMPDEFCFSLDDVVDAALKLLLP
jgi:hypothetical protein